MPKTILFIDDDSNITDMLCMHFKMKGFSVYAAGDGLEGIEVCRRVNPDVILIDLKMRHMDGDVAIPYLRAEVPQAKIILLSGYAKEAGALAAGNLEIDAYVEKPASIVALCTMVRDMLLPTDSVLSENLQTGVHKAVLGRDRQAEEECASCN